ncbi:MAG: ras-related protein Rab-35 [Harvfovirus sp.]|uniref:Ras-related protein Rab-35 n=1 Tax=Harvfovirus sp. TaxID=2487768 RepID=A0A3G5A446_9VIRU|nr:MAG: ras-related protein Rab-35 [Harvfovirus sp.]
MNVPMKAVKKKAALPDHRFKVALLGETHVGKTSIANVFAGKVFSTNYITTIGTDFMTATRTVNEKTIRLDIWDLAGSERFQHLIHACVRGAHGIIIVYDVNNQKSLSASVALYKKLYDGGKDCVMLVGTKNDLETKVIESELEEVKKDLDVKAYTTSAKTGENLEDIFQILIKNMILTDKDLVRDPTRIVLVPEKKENGASACCR